MFKLTVATETDQSTENFTTTAKTAKQVEEFKQQLRKNAPAGSTATVKVEKA
jgi:hypothetical protein